VNLFDRFILTLYSLALIVVSVVVIAVLCKLVPPSVVQMYMDNILLEGGLQVPYVVTAAIFLLISIRFFFSAFFTGKKRKAKSIYQHNELGLVNISFDTIRAIAERAAKKVKGVRELKTVVKTGDRGHQIVLRISVDGETSIPEMTQKMQADVKEQVETITGIEITEVAVNVEEVVSAENQPVRVRRLD